MKRYLLIIVGLMLVMTFFSGCTEIEEIFEDEETTIWTWNLLTTTSTIISFTEEQITVDGAAPEEVFANVKPDNEIWVYFEDPDDGWIDWYSERYTNDLDHIYPDKIYSVMVSVDCVLIIER